MGCHLRPCLCLCFSSILSWFSFNDETNLILFIWVGILMIFIKETIFPRYKCLAPLSKQIDCRCMHLLQCSPSYFTGQFNFVSISYYPYCCFYVDISWLGSSSFALNCFVSLVSSVIPYEVFLISVNYDIGILIEIKFFIKGRGNGTAGKLMPTHEHVSLDPQNPCKS